MCQDHNLYLLEALFVMSILSTVSLWMLISHVVITVVSLIIDGVLVSSDKTTITGVAVEQSWLSLLIMMWFQIPTIMVALHFYT